MENKSSINISKLTSDKGVKKLDLQNIKSLRHDSISGGFRESNPVILSNNYKNNGDKESYIDKIITKDYEQFIEFTSQEDYFSDNLVNLQNPYFYIPLCQKRNFSNKNDYINKNNKEKDDFLLNLQTKFIDSGSSIRKSNIVYKIKK